MAARVYATGPVLEDGGTLFIADGLWPVGTVAWALTAGGGTLTPLQPRANAGGVATAKYTPAADSEGDTVTVQVTSYA